MIAMVRAWIATRSERERWLLGLAVAVALAAMTASTVATVHEDLRTLSARVQGRERELAQVRRLARTVAATSGGSGGDASLSALLQSAAEAAGLGDRLAAMSPTAATTDTPARLRLRVSGTSLAEAIGFLHALGGDSSSPGIAHLGLRKHPDDVQRFDLTLEATGAPTP